MRNLCPIHSGGDYRAWCRWFGPLSAFFPQTQGAGLIGSRCVWCLGGLEPSGHSLSCNRDRSKGWAVEKREQ